MLTATVECLQLIDRHTSEKFVQRNRLASGGRLDRQKIFTFRFNNRFYRAYKGDTLASALLANGVYLIGRSFKYSRPRGILAAGVEEPNAIVQLGATEATQTPNVRATEQALFDGLVSHSVKGWPSVEFDAMSLFGKMAGEAMGPGFYYKTFMFPAYLWESYEKVIRQAAGLGRCSSEPDPDIYDHMHHRADVVVVGAGPAGLIAAQAAARTGVRVLLADEQSEMGGSLLFSSDMIDEKPALVWAHAVLEELRACTNVTLLSNSVVTGYHDQNFLTINERRTHRIGDSAPSGVSRERLHKVRATSVVLATGAHERPLVFANNDVPGCMLPSAISQYIRRYAVVPGDTLVVMTTNDSAYQCAFDWDDVGRHVAAIIDTRTSPDGAVTQIARERGICVIDGSAVVEAKGGKRVTGALVSAINAEGTFTTGQTRLIECDVIASSGGWSPAVHLSCHTGSRPVWHEKSIGFVPGDSHEHRWCAGSITGRHSLATCLSDGAHCGYAAAQIALADRTDRTDRTVEPVIETRRAARSKDGNRNANKASQTSVQVSIPSVETLLEYAPMALFLVPHTKTPSRAPKQFVDFQNDVTAAGIQVSTREGFESIEHVKRYTAMGFGTDQGKTGNVNGMAIVADILNQSIAETGTTIFRPNYTPVTFGAVAGNSVGDLFDPKRFTPMHQWHLQHEAKFENVGQWMRPWYYPRNNESMQEALIRECLATREDVGILDASTLGKIDIQGKDAREFLSRVYTNAWAKLAPGRSRYGLMCGEDGMIMDDGVTSCLADNHFLMTTTTGGAAHVLAWLELYHQTEWAELDVYFTSVTDHWATISIAGPKSRDLLMQLTTDIDLDGKSFSFMDWRSGTVAGVPARVFRISFTGDLSYEINVPAHYGMHVWQSLFDQGDRYNLTPYGTETMHILRAEKGFIIVGQDTDGSNTPADLNHGWAVNHNKPYSFIGKRGMLREDCTRSGRKQLVGLKTLDPSIVIPEGSQAVCDPKQEIPMTMVGHVTSSYYSPSVGRGIAMGLIKDGLNRMGEAVYFPQADGQVIAAEISDSRWFDIDGQRHKA